MKKIFTLLCAVMFFGAVNAQSRYDVENKTQFTDALSQIAALPAGSAAYVYIKGDINVSTLKKDEQMVSTLRNIHFVGVNNEETGDRATLRMEMQMPAGNSESDGFSLHFENLKVMQSQGVWGNSKHLINFKDAEKHYIDTLEFVNCELTELCRSIYRGEVNGAGEDFSGAGTMKVFRMENCTVHNGFRQYDAMPAIYMAQPVNKMIFKNNTFYDLTYLNGLVSFGTMTENTGRQAVEVYFENNTICAWSKASLLGYAGGVSTESVFHIKNNIILQPNWIDDMNGRQDDSKDVHEVEGETWTDKNGNEHLCRSLTQDEVDARIADGVVLTKLDGGLVQLENNMLYGYKYQNLTDAIDAGDVIPIGDDENQESEFTFMTMEDAGFAWSDFTDAKSDMFQISINHAVHAAGKNGAPMGDENNYTSQVIRIVHLNAQVAGSTTATITVTPQKDAYVAGDVVTLTVNLNGSLNTFKGWSNGMTDTTIELTLNSDLDITANCEEIDFIAVWNLDDISSNNVVKAPPVKPNHGSEAFTLDYARYFSEDGAYKTGADVAAADAYDGAKKVIQTRNNKVTGDIRNCYIIQTPTTEFTTEGGGKADYLFINFNEAQNATTLQFFVASDNVPYKTYAVSYATDDTSWTTVSTFSMDGKAQTNEWYPVSVSLPALPAGAKVRIKGVESEGYYVAEAFIEAGSSVSTEYLFVAEVILSAGGAAPAKKGDVNGDGKVNVGDIMAVINVMAGQGQNIDKNAADVNNDGSVNVGDIMAVINIMAGK